MRIRPAARFLLLEMLLTLLVLTACVNRGASMEPPPFTAELQPSELSIIVPSSIRAGETLFLTVKIGGSSDHHPVMLLAQGTFGDYFDAGVSESGQITFELGADVTEFAGAVTLIARVEGLESRANVTIEPKPPADPLVTLVGPRSLVAAEESTMLTAVVHDALGNPVADETTVDVRVQYPAGDAVSLVETKSVTTANLLAWTRLEARSQTGRMRMSASAGDAHSAERDVMIVPGPPADFAVTVTPSVSPADGRQLVEISTETLVDEFGNRLLDGTTVTFLVEEAGTLVRSIPAQVIDGVASTTLQAPTQPGALWIHAVIANARSEPTMALFTPGPAIQPFDVEVVSDTKTVSLRAGPLVGNLNQFVADGTLVTFRFTDTIGNVTENRAVTEDGYAQLDMRLASFAPGLVQVEAVVGIANGATEFRAP